MILLKLFLLVLHKIALGMLLINIFNLEVFLMLLKFAIMMLVKLDGLMRLWPFHIVLVFQKTAEIKNLDVIFGIYIGVIILLLIWLQV